MDRNNALELEWIRNVEKIAERNTSINELEYFINTALSLDCSYHEKSGQKLILLGNLFPIEVVRAMDIDYCYVYGGSFEMTLSQDNNLPKDTNDFTRSVFGRVKSEDLNLSKSDMVLMPLYNDDMRKLRALLSDFVTVICYEVPIDKDNPLQTDRYISEIGRIITELEKHFHRKLSSERLEKQFEISQKASEAFNILESIYNGKRTSLSASAFLLIANSYHLCKDVNEWTMHLRQLNKELSENTNSTLNDNPDVLLLASPIYEPNYKLILLIEEMELNVRAIIHPDIQHLKLAGNKNFKKISARELAIMYLDADISPVYLRNTTNNKLIEKSIDENGISGIIAPVIKGQIDYEYGIKEIKNLIENRRISLIRIETILAYHDYEQIRVRLEAFSEMLNRAE